MNYKTPTLIALTAAFSLTAVSAHAVMPAPKEMPHRAAMHEKIDANGDGKISVQEMTDHRTKGIATAFKKADENGDGFLSREEMKSMHHKRAEKREEWKENEGKKRPGKWEKSPETE